MSLTLNPSAEMLEYIDVPVCLTSSDLTILHVNTAFSLAFDLSSVSLTQTNLKDLLKLDGESQLGDSSHIINKPIHYAQLKEIKPRFFNYRVEGKYKESENICVWTFAPVTESDEYRKFQSISRNAANLGLWEYDLKKRRLNQDETTKRIHGLSCHDEISVAEAIDFYLGVSEKERISELVQNCIQLGSPFDGEFKFVDRKGNEKWVRSFGMPSYKDGEIEKIFGSIQDITEQKQLLQNIEKDKERYELVNKATNEVVLDWDLVEGRMILGGNFSKVLGHRVNDEEMTPSEWMSWVHFDDKEKLEKKFYDFLKNPKKKVARIKYRMLTHRGVYIHVFHVMYFIRDMTGRVTRMVGSLKSIEKEVKTKKKLEQSFKRLDEFRRALDHSTNLVLTDEKGVILDVNEGTCKSSGYTREELIGNHTRIFKSGFQTEDFYKNLWQTVSAGKDWRSEIKNKRKDGSFYWLDAIIVPLLDEEQKPYQYLDVRIDITERKEAEEQIIKAFENIKISEQKYSALFQFSPFPMWVYDIETGKFLNANQAAARQYGYSEEEFLEMSIFDIRPESEIEAVKSFIQDRGVEENIFNRLFTHRKKSGEIISVEISSIPIVSNGRQARHVIAIDVTEKMDYLQKVETQNEALKEIAWIQSHVVRAPVAKIMGLVELLKDDYAMDPEKRQVLDHIVKSSRELDQVIRNIVDKANSID